MTQKEQTGKSSETLFVGIDLGTSKSTISASNGSKFLIESYVGWPKDFIAAKVLGKPVLFGADALDHRLSLEMCRPLAHGVIKEGVERSEDAVKELIQELIRLVEPRDGQQIKAIVGVPTDSKKVNKLAVRRAVTGCVHSLMVVSEPFAVAYSMDLLDNAFIIDIGAGTADFCIMHGTMPNENDQKTITIAGDYIDDQLFDLMSDRYPHSRFTKNMVRQFKESFSFVGDVPEDIKVELPLDGKPAEHDIKAEIKKACETILTPIIDTAADMISKFDPEFQKKIKNKIILAGGGSKIRNLADHVANGLKEYGKCKVVCVEDPIYAGSHGGLKLAMDMPANYWEEL